VLLLGCSPEARRVRDGGDGADPGNKDLVAGPVANPQPADTTLWPGRAPAAVERLARGEMPPPASVSAPAVPATTSQQHTFDKGTSANPRAKSR
jgi:hypothetical protein